MRKLRRNLNKIRFVKFTEKEGKSGSSLLKGRFVFAQNEFRKLGFPPKGKHMGLLRNPLVRAGIGFPARKGFGNSNSRTNLGACRVDLRSFAGDRNPTYRL